MAKPQAFRIDSQIVRRGETSDVHLRVSQRYTGDPVTLPIRVIRARRPGPKLFVTAAVHGDELNGMGIVHELMFGPPIDLQRGTLVLVPVVNIFGFETHDRYMTDRRDLNRFFPGSETGNPSSRLACTIFHKVILKCDYGIDLHTAAMSRTNFPNVRGDLSQPGVRRLARAFGCELIVHGRGPDGSLRRQATRAGTPTIILEAGESRKIEPGVLEIGVRGVRNVLIELGMLPGEPTRPTYQVRVDKAVWIRADVGGILRFHVSPGETVEAGQPVATNVNVFGLEQNVIVTPVDGIILGMTTLPTVQPGEPVCHVAVPNRSLRSIRRAIARASDGSLHRRLRDDLATNISVSEWHEERETAAREED